MLVTEFIVNQYEKIKVMCISFWQISILVATLPEWTILCRLRSDWWAKALSHSLHLNGLSPSKKKNKMHTFYFNLPFLFFTNSKEVSNIYVYSMWLYKIQIYFISQKSDNLNKNYFTHICWLQDYEKFLN